VVAELGVKFFECRNDLSRALLVRRMAAVVNDEQTRVGQITSKAFSEA
jgi:hypothetical protein